MPFPVIPLLLVAGQLGLIAAFAWYQKLSKSAQDQANEVAGEVAMELFGKALDQLTKSQFSQVGAVVQKRLGS